MLGRWLEIWKSMETLRKSVRASIFVVVASGCLATPGEVTTRQAKFPLSLTPTVLTIPIQKSYQFYGQYGLPPYKYQITFGGGSISSDGLYTAPGNIGQAVIEVTDSENSRALAVVSVISALIISPSSMELTVTGSKSFSTVGGTAPYSYAIVCNPLLDDGGPTDPDPLNDCPDSGLAQVTKHAAIDSTNGLLVAKTSGTFSVRVTDSKEFFTEAIVTVLEKPVINPRFIVVEHGGKLKFSVTGGTPQSEFSAVTGTGTINSLSGVYLAPQISETATVRITDSMGFYDTATINVFRPNPVAGGLNHSCSLNIGSQRVKCWGSNAFGQLGLGHSNNIGDNANEMGIHMSPISFGSGFNPTQLASGHNHNCAVSTMNQVKCWGDNAYGQLGNATTGGTLGSVAGDIAASSPINFGSFAALSVSLGQSHSCAIVQNTMTFEIGLRCWGRNNFGQLGNGTTTDSNTPVAVNLGFTPSKIVLGDNHSCAFSTAGDLKCWGLNDKGQIGIGTSVNALAPANVNLGTGFFINHLAAGANHSCAVSADGRVKCWGDNSSGQLGLNALTQTSIGDEASEVGAGIPLVNLDAIIDGVASFVTVHKVLLGSRHSCVVFDDNGLRCWGANDFGQLGRENTDTWGDQTGEVGSTQAKIELGSSRYMIVGASKGDHTCVVLDDSRIKCWGKNSSGQLGHGNVITRGDGPSEMGDSLPFTEAL